jgi:hypothetical protein
MNIIQPLAETYLQDEYRQLFRNLTYQERVAGIRPFELAKAAKEAGAAVLTVDVRTQCYSMHDTKVYLKDPCLGDRDLTRECADACKQYGLKFVGYVAPQSFEPWFDKHPEWQQRRGDGSLTETGMWRSNACPSGPFGEFLCDELREITRNYGPHGYYIDGILFDMQACYCDDCRAKFRAEFGRDMPPKPDWNSPEWYAFIQWRYRQIGAAAKRMADAVHEIDPKVEMIFNCPHAWCGWYSGQSYLPGQFINRVGTETHAGVAAPTGSQQFWTQMTHAVWRVLMTRMIGCGRRSHSYTYYTPDLLEPEGALETNSVLAAGGIPCIQGNAPFMPQIFARIGAAEPYLVQSVEVPTVGLVCSDTSRDAFYKADDKSYFAELHGIFRELTETQTPMNLLGDHQLAAGEWGSGAAPGALPGAMPGAMSGAMPKSARACLSDYKLIVLPNVSTLSSDAWSNVRKYVEDGGTVIATYKSGLFDGIVPNADGRLLWPDSGLSFLGDIVTDKPFWVQDDGTPQDVIPPVPNQFLLMDDRQRKAWGMDFSRFVDGAGWAPYEVPGYLDGNLHVPAEAIRVKASSDWKTVLPLGYRVGPKDEPAQTPGLLRRKLGKGTVYYVAFDIGKLFAAADIALWRTFFKKLIDQAVGKQLPLRVEAPECVFLSLWRQEKQGRYVIHLVNDLSTVGRPCGRQHMRPDVVPVNAVLTIRLPGVTSVEQVVGEAKVRVRPMKDGLRVTLRNLTERAILTAK